MKIPISLFLFCLFIFQILNAQIAQIPKRTLEKKEMSGDLVEAVRVGTAVVVMADYDLIARDFEVARKQTNETEKQWKERVDKWLVSETAFIHKNQVKANSVNTSISTSSETKETIRPKGYNRAHVIPVADSYMDAKGTGAATPAQKHHRNGLSTLGEGIREFIYEKMVSHVFKHSAAPVTTVGTYAVIDYGFDVVHPDKTRSRAGYVLRQAHTRAAGFNSVLPVAQMFIIEKVLRKYGITSSGETFAYPGSTWDYTNIQGTNNKDFAEVVDFGAFLSVEKFTRKLVDTSQNLLVAPDSPSFVQPDSNLRVPLEQWGSFDKEDPKSDRIWVWSHELAEAWAQGRATRDAFETHFNNFLGPVRSRLPLLSCRSLFSTSN